MISPTFPIQNWKPFGLDQKLSGCLDPQEVAKNDYTPLMACYTANNSTKAWMKTFKTSAKERAPLRIQVSPPPEKLVGFWWFETSHPTGHGNCRGDIELTNFELITFNVSPT